MLPPFVDVAVSIVRAQDGRVLLAERTARQMAAGFWELPGGKVDPGETPAQAAARELHEEIGIQARHLRPWISYEHHFPTRRLRLHFFRAEGWTGTPHGREGQRIAWVDPANPAVAPVLASNERVLRALALPPLYVVLRCGPEIALGALHAALAGGARLVEWRAPELAPDQRVSVARRMVDYARPYGARFVLGGASPEAQRAGAAGLRSSATEVQRMTARPRTGLWIVSCHSEAELARATALGADAALLAPILPGGAGCGRAPLGWPEFARRAAQATIPVYAQGGMTADALPQALAAGAAGIALSSSGPGVIA